MVTAAFAKSVPVKIKSPPPRVGETLDIAGVLYENVGDEVESWFPTLMMTGRLPPPEGVFAVTVVLETHATLVHNCVPIFMVMVEVDIPKFVPVNVVATPPCDVLGFDRLSRAYTVYKTQPTTTQDAVAMKFAPVNNSYCIPNLGIAYAKGGKPSVHEPVILYFTASGHLSGVGTKVYGSVETTLLKAGYFIETDKNTYEINVAFRNASTMCTKDVSPPPGSIGDRLIINPRGLARSVPTTMEDALNEKYHRGSCFNGMGTHYFYDLDTAPKMSWKSSNLMPVVPMYTADGSINAIFFASSTRQQTIFPPSSNQWEPVPLPNAAMCKNWCDKDCTFSGTSVWSTMHFYFRDYTKVTCPTTSTCTFPGISCCPGAVTNSVEADEKIDVNKVPEIDDSSKDNDNKYGPTFSVKVRNNTKYGRRIYVHTDCRVSLLNGNDIQKDMTYSVISVSKELGTPCESNTINGLGVSANGTYAVVSHGNSISVLYFVENEYEENDLAMKSKIIDINNMNNDTKNSENIIFTSYKRIGNGIRDKINNRDLFIGIGVDQQKDDYVIIIASSGKGATLSLKIIKYMKVGEGMYDVRPYDSNLADGNILANCKNGLQVLNYNIEKNRLVTVGDVLQASCSLNGGGCDGMDVTPKYAYIAKQQDGLYIYNLDTKVVVSEIKDGLQGGWAGGVRVVGNLALVAADPGLVIYDIRDPGKPSLIYVCKMAPPGKGWNVAVDKATSTVFLADNKGGLQIVQLVNGGKGEIIGHYGMGTMQSCEGNM
eukprot:g9523.t1